MRRTGLAAIIAAGALCACATSAPAQESAAIAPVATAAPAGEYRIDKAHTSVLFRVNHLGFSRYTARFLRYDATLQLDPENPSTAQLTATVETASLETDYPDVDAFDFNAFLTGPQWLSAEAHPQMRFVSRRVEMTGPSTARIHGDFTMRGVTRPLVLEATFNGGYAGHPLERNARIGFSAHGTLNRSDYGMTLGIPEPGTTMGVSDAVEILIETEFTGPAWTEAE